MNVEREETEERRSRGGRQETMGRHVGGDESAYPRKVAPWPWRFSAWNWSEKRDQFESTRLSKSQI